METKKTESVTIMGCVVTIRFAATPNTEVVDSVKDILRTSFFRRCSEGEKSA